jgi:glycosyltransferase involved in cell wall biosynthesis
MSLPVLLVVSPLRWSLSGRRPQHLLARLAERWQVLLVETPQHDRGAPRLDVAEVAPHLTVLTPRTPLRATGFHDSQHGPLQRLLRQHIDARRLHVAVAWLCTPMALPLANALGADCLVYDCMEELSPADGACPQLQARDLALMRQAALVLTAGPSQFNVRRHLHDNIHCLPSAVDPGHFSPATLDIRGPLAQQARTLQSALPRARLGFAGVIDERLDMGLIAALAERHPAWSIIMAGPVTGLDPARLPRRPNIHWLGPQSYDLLPHLLAGWDLALMPFALNASTRFMSPTQTLEFMAAGLPVVSTALHDVQALYFPAVTIASSQGFVRACEAVLAEGTLARCARLAEMARRVARHSWTGTADTVHRLLTQALAGAHEPTPAGPAERWRVTADRPLPAAPSVARA